MKKDEERLYWLNREMKDVEKQRNALQSVLDDRSQRRDAAQTARDNIYNELRQMQNFMDQTRSKVTHATTKTFSRSTTANLRAARGYGMDAGSTYYQRGRKSSSSRR